ncbi:hypothetical protein AB5I41_00350 [Sphingomonas sp. MMS24-JH45]
MEVRIQHHRALGLEPPRLLPRPLSPEPSRSPSVSRSSRSRSSFSHAAARAARFFAEKFPGRSMYAVEGEPEPRADPDPVDNGITHYDVASIGEVRMVARTLPEATLCFMHPVKAEEAIAEAYFTHGVRTFSLDSMEELEKIVRATRSAADLTLCVRLRVSSSIRSLASKFGEVAAGGEGPADGDPGRMPSASFHVGSQAMTPDAYAQAMERVREAIVAAAVTVDVVDVGGGFPSAYPGMTPPPLERYFDAHPPRVRIAADQLFGGAVGGAGPRAVRRICQPRAGGEASRQRTVHQRRRLWRAVRCWRTSAGASPLRCCASRS